MVTISRFYWYTSGSGELEVISTNPLKPNIKRRFGLPALKLSYLEAQAYREQGSSIG